MTRWWIAAALALAMTVSGAGAAQAQVADTPQLLEADRVAAVAPFDSTSFYRTFRDAKVQVDGVTIHYVTGGSGPVVLLLHGWPASWSYWHRIMPQLAAGHTVISVDMPGFGSSGTAPSADKVAVSALLHKLMIQLGHNRVSLVSHDMGGPVAYAYAAQFPDGVDRVVFTETAIPGFGFADGSDHDLLKITAQSAGSIWHFAAFMKPGMVEMLISGHERQFIDAMVTESYTNPAAFSEDEAQELTRWISSPTGLSGGIAYRPRRRSGTTAHDRPSAQLLGLHRDARLAGHDLLQHPVDVGLCEIPDPSGSEQGDDVAMDAPCVRPDRRRLFGTSALSQDEARFQVVEIEVAQLFDRQCVVIDLALLRRIVPFRHPA